MSDIVLQEAGENLISLVERLKQKSGTFTLVVSQDSSVFQTIADVLTFERLLKGSKVTVIFETQNPQLRQWVQNTSFKLSDLDKSDAKMSTELEKDSKKTQPANDFGFVHGKDIAQDQPLSENEAVPDSGRKDVPSKPSVGQNQMSVPQSILGSPNKSVKRSKKKILIVVGGLVLLIVCALAGFVFLLPKATIQIHVAGELIERKLELTVDPAVQTVDAEKFIIPGEMIDQNVSAEKTIDTTGKAEVGSKAVGVITIYNKQITSTLELPAGTQFVHDSGKVYLLDGAVSVEPAVKESTEGGSVITYGKLETTVTAVEIGKEYNVSAATDATVYNFSIGILRSSEAEAANREAISGGSKKEVIVVAQVDKDNLLATLTESLVVSGKEAIVNSLSAQQKAVESAINGTVVTETYSADVGEEQSQVTLSLAMNFKAVVYSEGELSNLLSDYLADVVPDGYRLSEEQQLTVENAQALENGEGLHLIGSISAALLPDVDSAAIRTQVLGKHPEVAADYIRSQPSVEGVDIVFWPPMPSGWRFLPRISSRLNIEIVSSR